MDPSPALRPAPTHPTSARALAERVGVGLLIVGAVAIAALLVWQGITSAGAPDPTRPHTTRPAAALDVAVLVFREGLECVLVLAAILAGLQGANKKHQRPIGVGIGVGLLASLATWFVAVAIVTDLTTSFDALSVQAATGLLAIVVLLVVMNWFFHNVYWTGWISMHNRRKRTLLERASDPGVGARRVLLGLGLLGFASVYREGFEIVLFLQSYQLSMGGLVVFYGAAAGLVLTACAAFLTFVGHRKLPYKRMLIVTGVMLAGVLVVMVGEQVSEMQLAHWIGTTNIGWMKGIPDWAGVWFSIFPNVETVVAQAIALALVLGSYFVAQRAAHRPPAPREDPSVDATSSH